MNAPHTPERMEVSEECTHFWDWYYQCISRIGSTFQPTTLSQAQQEAFWIIEKIIGAKYLQELLKQNITKNDKWHLETPKELREIFDTASKLAHSIHSQDDANKTRKILFELMQFAVNINNIYSEEIRDAFKLSPLSQETKLVIVETYLRTGDFPTTSWYDPKAESLFTTSIREIFEWETWSAISTVISQHLKEAAEILRKSKEF